jgi:hypothetical protein
MWVAWNGGGLFEKGASKKIIELYEYLQFKKRMDQ